jgi:hypothetical protein
MSGCGLKENIQESYTLPGGVDVLAHNHFRELRLFTRPNATVAAALFIFALSAAGAIFSISELSRPFQGMMQISSAPLRNALVPLSP